MYNLITCCKVYEGKIYLEKMYIKTIKVKNKNDN